MVKQGTDCPSYVFMARKHLFPPLVCWKTCSLPPNEDQPISWSDQKSGSSICCSKTNTTSKHWLTSSVLFLMDSDPCVKMSFQKLWKLVWKLKGGLKTCSWFLKQLMDWNPKTKINSDQQASKAVLSSGSTQSVHQNLPPHHGSRLK